MCTCQFYLGEPARPHPLTIVIPWACLVWTRRDVLPAHWGSRCGLEFQLWLSLWVWGLGGDHQLSWPWSIWPFITRGPRREAPQVSAPSQGIQVASPQAVDCHVRGHVSSRRPPGSWVEALGRGPLSASKSPAPASCLQPHEGA